VTLTIEEKKERKTAYMRVWRATHKEQNTANRKAYEQSHREEIRERRRVYSRLWRTENKELLRQLKAAEYQRHKESIRARQAEYYQQNADRIKAVVNAYRLSHLEKKKAGDAAYYLTHGDERRIAASVYYYSHLKEVSASNKARRLANPDKEREYSYRRRTGKNSNIIQAVKLGAVMQRDRMICGICHKRVARKGLSFDHIVPLSKGGTHAEWNLQVSHLRCNMRRGAGRIPAQMRMAL